MKSKTYNFIKLWTIILPAIAAFYGLLADTWKLPFGQQIVTTIAGVTALLSAVLKGISDNYFRDKEIIDADAQEGEE